MYRPVILLTKNLITMTNFQEKGFCRVLIVAREEIVFNGINFTLNGAGAGKGPYDLVFKSDHARTGAEAMSKLRDSRYDVLLLSVRIMTGRTIQLIGTLKDQRPQMRILVIADFPEHEEIQMAMRGGASGYMEYCVPGAELRELVQKAYYKFNGSLFSKEISQIEYKALEQTQVDKKQVHDGKPKVVSRRELQVLQLIGDGKTMAQIATIMSISESTAETHSRNARIKLGASSQAHAVKLAYELGLIHLFDLKRDGLFG